MEAFKNCMTPLQVACVLGYDAVAIYLVENNSNPNLRTVAKGYTAMHLAVLANKPEILIELLTKTNADPMIEDEKGRTLLDMVY
jgi:ankyrin repeat protein